MTAEVLRVDTAALRQAGPAMRVLSTSVGATLRRLSSALAVEGTCWGTDEMGAAFDREYSAAAHDVWAAFTVLGDHVRGAGNTLLAIADDLDASDGRAQTRLG